MRVDSKAHVCGGTWCISVSWRVLLGRNLEFKLSTALGETLLYVRTCQVQSAWKATFPPYVVCPCELACVPRILLQLSVSISRLVISSGHAVCRVNWRSGASSRLASRCSMSLWNGANLMIFGINRGCG